MSLQTLDPILDIDFDLDIEAELEDEEYTHALGFCYKHTDKRWHPVAGTIVQALCGRLLRSKGKEGKDMCPECLEVANGKTFPCYVCG